MPAFSGMAASAAGKAADVQADAAEDMVKMYKKFFRTTRKDLAPFKQQGYKALNMLGQMFGLDPITRSRVNPEWRSLSKELKSKKRELEIGFFNQSNQGPLGGGRDSPGIPPLAGGAIPEGGNPKLEQEIADLEEQLKGTDRKLKREMKSFSGSQLEQLSKSPGYKFRLKEGTRAIDRSAAAQGRLQSGGTKRELARYGQGLATQEWNAFANRLASLAGVGQVAATDTGQFGAQSAQGQAGAMAGGATARASGYIGKAQSYNQMFENILSVGGIFMHKGGRVEGDGNVPVVLEAGEYVVSKKAAKRLGPAVLKALNSPVLEAGAG